MNTALMRTFVFLIVMLLTVSQSFSQRRAERLGRQEFEMFSYPSAIGYLERVKNKSVEVNRMLAQSHAFMGDYRQASSYFARIVSGTEYMPSDFWEYAQVLMALENYTEAKNQLQRFYQLQPNDSRAIRYSQAGDFVQRIRSKESNISSVRHLRINGEHQDFGPIYYRKQLIFASSREDATVERGLWSANRLPYLRPFIADKTTDGELLNPRPFLPGLLQSDFHIGPIAISKEEDIMAVTVNFEKTGRRANQTINLQLMISYFVDGRWTELVPVPFNDPEYSVGHATFTADGKIMYFASDMPGGKGGTDIYRIKVPGFGDGWGTPENVTAINTEGDEMFPFYHEDDLLFFASDGHVGLGGLDIFYTEIINGEPQEVINMGYPINSSRDDFSLIIDNQFKTGYFSSRRDSGFGNDDIFYFTLKEPLKEKPEEEPRIVEIFVPVPQPVAEPKPEPEPEYQPGMLIQINPIYFDFDRSHIRPDAAAELEKVVSVMNQYPNMVVELGSHTDCRGTDRYNELLSRARANSSLQYIRERITNPDRISGTYYGKTQLLNRCDCSEMPPCTEAEHQLNRRTEFKIIAM